MYYDYDVVRGRINVLTEAFHKRPGPDISNLNTPCVVWFYM